MHTKKHEWTKKAKNVIKSYVIKFPKKYIQITIYIYDSVLQFITNND